MKTDLRRWNDVFRTLANVNRLKIIILLSRGEKLHVGEITESLRISFKATSNHLAILKRMNVVEAEGTAGHVFYTRSAHLPKDFRRAFDVFLA